MDILKNISFLLTLLLIASNSCHCQVKLTWEDLSDVEWTEVKDTVFGVSSLTANFGESILRFDGEEVQISGYVIPLDAMGLSYALSKTSYASCFFCGQAGPETVLELKVSPRSVPVYEQKTELLTFEGVLEVKESNDTGLNYILNHAKRMK